MKYLTIPNTVRRAIAVIAAASVAGLVATTLASSPAPALGARAALTSQTESTVTAAIPACSAASLGAWVAVGQGNGAAGSIYYPLQFTNLSGHSCSMRGFPGVSVVNRNGNQLGSAAGWDHVTSARTVTLAPGATAHAVLRWSDATVTTAPGCAPVFTAFELRVYPPNQYHATYAAFDLEACSHAGPVYLDVGPILPGVGTING